MKTASPLPAYLTSAPAKGVYRRWKTFLAYALPALMLLAPQWRYERGQGVPDQAVLFDVAGRRVYCFGVELLPDELFFITAGLIGGAMALFAVTARFGRVWCGFLCPQTVWTDIFVAVERFLQGGGRRRNPLTRAATYVVWALAAVCTSYGWVSYFSDARELPGKMLRGEASPALYAMFAVFAAATYLLAGAARGKVCTHMCPWPRFQSAMFDGLTKNIFYDAARGEPRGKGGKQRRQESALGDCVDCGRCVVVCPMEIDIRNGLQLSCIGCGLCADACDTVMEKIGAPKGLVRYDLPERGAPATPWRPWAFAAFSALSVVGVSVFLLVRTPFSLGVVHRTEPLFVALSDGSVRNAYDLHMVNRTGEARAVMFSAEGVPGAVVSLSGRPEDAAPQATLTLPPRASLTEHFYIHAPAPKGGEGAPRSSAVTVTANDGARFASKSVVWWSN